MSTSMPAPEQERRRAPLMFYGYWIVVGALLAQFVTVGAQISVVGVFVKPMTEDLGWSRTEFFLAETLGQFVFASTGFLIGTYVDRFGARPLMLIGVAVAAASLLLAAEVSELWQWMLLRGVFFMLGGALAGNLVVNVTLANWFVTKRGRAMGIASMGVSLSGVVWPPLMTAFSDEFGWRAGWRAMAVVLVLFIVPVSMLMRRRPEDEGLHPDGAASREDAMSGEAAADYANSLTRREALRSRALYLVIAAFGLGVVGVMVMLTQTIPFLTDEGFSRRTASFMLVSMSLPALVSKPIWGFILEKVDPRPLAAVGFAVSAVAALLILFAATAGSVAMLLTGYALVGIGFGGQIPIQEVTWASFFGRRYLGAVRGVAMPFSFIIAAASPLAVAAYFDQVGNYDGAFYAISVLWAASALLILLVRKPAKGGDATPETESPG
jgi:MFS transporter, OFA family, oxalate/formate antiporter